MENKKPDWFNKENIIIAVLIAACVFAFWWLTVSIQSSYHAGYFRPQRYYQRHAGIMSVPPSVTDIQSWMTFDYLNKVFGLPPEYLEQTLNIQDNQYPNLQLKRYASRNNLDIQEFLKSAQSAIQAYKK